MSFSWVPRTPLAETALRRLEQRFPKPNEPPPIAWFMSGKVDYYYTIIETKPDEMPLFELERYLADTCAGLRVFPEVEFAAQSWKQTFNYLLPNLIRRCHQGYVLSDLVGYFFQVYTDKVPDLFPEFRTDILSTLGNAIMGPAFWGEHDLSKTTIQREWDIYHLFGENDFSSTLSPAMVFLP